MKESISFLHVVGRDKVLLGSMQPHLQMLRMTAAPQENTGRGGEVLPERLVGSGEDLLISIGTGCAACSYLKVS